jgi:hypothetical protein
MALEYTLTAKFRSDRVLSKREIDALTDRVHLEINEPQVTDDDNNIEDATWKSFDIKIEAQRTGKSQ